MFAVVHCFIVVSAAVMFAFQDNATVKKVVNALPRVGIGVKYGLPQTRFISLYFALDIHHLYVFVRMSGFCVNQMQQFRQWM
jgi:hypothetical protein